MRQRFVLVGSVVLFLATVMATPGLTQQPEPQGGQGTTPSVQVGVPQGRGAAPATGRGRQAGPPPGPVPRTADGKVILGGATPAVKGVWLPGGGGGQTLTD